MARKIRAVQYGVGAMGKMMVEMMLDKNIDVVGAICSEGSAKEGKELGEFCGLKPLGVYISSDAEKVIQETKPDIVIVSITTYLADLWLQVELCAKLGVNVITPSEESFYPWRTEAELAIKWDKLCKENNCSAYGCGYQDFYWGNEITQLAGTCHSIDAIEGYVQVNVNDYGPASARNHFVDLNQAEFDAEVARRGGRPNYMQMVGDLIIDGLGLTFKSVTETIYQTTAENDIYSNAYERIIPKGIGTGHGNVVHYETEEGVPIHIEIVSKIYDPAENTEDKNEWKIKGRPNIEVLNKKPATDVLTCSQMISRFADVINAPPGLLKAFSMPPIKYKRKFDLIE